MTVEVKIRQHQKGILRLLNEDLMRPLSCILLIDDDEATNNLNMMVLKSFKAAKKIEIAWNGKKGIDYINSCAKEDLPELILLDINMPFMDGFEFLEAYKSLEESRKKGVKLIMLTTSKNPKDLARAESIPELQEVIEKPLMRSKVAEIWNKYFL